LIGGSRRTETATLAGPTPPRIIGVVAWWRYLPLYSKETKKQFFLYSKETKKQFFANTIYSKEMQKSIDLCSRTIKKRQKNLHNHQQ
jgi:hypothetical protein